MTGNAEIFDVPKPLFLSADLKRSSSDETEKDEFII